MFFLIVYILDLHYSLLDDIRAPAPRLAAARKAGVATAIGYSL